MIIWTLEEFSQKNDFEVNWDRLTVQQEEVEDKEYSAEDDYFNRKPIQPKNKILKKIGTG